MDKSMPIGVYIEKFDEDIKHLYEKFGDVRAEMQEIKNRIGKLEKKIIDFEQ